eukprot:Clim_evm77s144 gene=Clim_evmTU77s144
MAEENQQQNITNPADDSGAMHRAYGVIPFVANKLGNGSFAISYLLLKDRRGGHWGFPKGYPEATDASPKDSGIREFEEETGLTQDKLTIHEDLGTFKVEYQKPMGNGRTVPKISEFWAGQLADQEDVKVQAQEISAYSWCTYEETLEKLSFENMKNVFAELHKAVLLKHKS